MQELPLRSVNPATEELIQEFEPYSAERVEEALSRAASTFRSWRKTSFRQRADLLLSLAARLRGKKADLARLITTEMGKPISQAEAEIEKCAWNCEYYAQHGEGFLAREPRDAGASESYVEFHPLGTVLAIMPWNYPIWQVLRFATPAVLAGNTALLKHSPNVCGCALAVEDLFKESGFPEGVFQTLLLPTSMVPQLIQDSRVAAVTLTGSDWAGRSVAAEAGRAIKKCVLELGGSDPFIVLADADLDAAVETGVQARFQNSGQSCIAAKRFVIVEPVYEDFAERFLSRVAKLKMGDPASPATEIGPLARADLRDNLERQVQESVQAGSVILLGGSRAPGPGYFYPPTVLVQVGERMPAAQEEVFGPVAALFRVPDEEEALRLANQTRYGLGANLWTRDVERARSLTGEIEAGQVFINGMVASDPRLPFGGIKSSGYGRELSDYGIREFVNIQTVWIGPKRE